MIFFLFDRPQESWPAAFGYAADAMTRAASVVVAAGELGAAIEHRQDGEGGRQRAEVPG
jgi:hypothetical protein